MEVQYTEIPTVSTSEGLLQRMATCSLWVHLIHRVSCSTDWITFFISYMCDSTCFSGGFGYVGVVYLYKFTGNTLLQMVTVRQSASTAQYAGSMSMGNNILVVGDLTYNSNTGTVFVLVNQDANENGASWNFTVSQMLTVSGLTVSSQFGKSVSLVGNYLAVGTPGQRKLRIRHC
jgi:hypothetical protein